MAKPHHTGLGNWFPRALTLSPLSALSSPPALAQPGLASLYSDFQDAPLAPAHEKCDHTHWETPCLDCCPWTQIGFRRQQWIDSFGLKPASISLICWVPFRRESGIIRPDVKWQSIALEDCFQLLSSKWNEPNPSQPISPIFTHLWADEVA